MFRVYICIEKFSNRSKSLCIPSSLSLYSNTHSLCGLVVFCCLFDPNVTTVRADWNLIASYQLVNLIWSFCCCFLFYYVICSAVKTFIFYDSSRKLFSLVRIEELNLYISNYSIIKMSYPLH